MNVEIGQQLRQARQAQSLTLEQVAQATHVRVHYLKSLEDGDFAAIPSQAQARGFVRIYAGYLGLKSSALLADLQNPEEARARAGRTGGQPGGLQRSANWLGGRDF